MSGILEDFLPISTLEANLGNLLLQANEDYFDLRVVIRVRLRGTVEKELVLTNGCKQRLYMLICTEQLPKCK